MQPLVQPPLLTVRSVRERCVQRLAAGGGVPALAGGVVGAMNWHATTPGLPRLGGAI